MVKKEVVMDRSTKIVLATIVVCTLFLAFVQLVLSSGVARECVPAPTPTPVVEVTPSPEPTVEPTATPTASEAAALKRKATAKPEPFEVPATEPGTVNQ
jgi:hypothetical protein